MGKPKTIKAFTNLGFSFGSNPLKSKSILIFSLGLSATRSSSSPQEDYDGESGGERGVLGVGPSCQPPAPPRTCPTAVAWCRWRACCCSLRGSVESFVGRNLAVEEELICWQHPRRRRRRAPIAGKPCGGIEPGAGGRRGWRWVHVERPEPWHREVVRSGIFMEMDMEKWVFAWMLQGVVMQVFHACEWIDAEWWEGKVIRRRKWVWRKWVWCAWSGMDATWHWIG